MDILLFTCSDRKAEYCTLKLKAYGHTVCTERTLASIHHALRFSDPDFVIVDSDTFPDPKTDYRTIIDKSRRKFLLYYDEELLSFSEVTDSTIPDINELQKLCKAQIADTLRDIQTHKTLTDEHFSAKTPEERKFLKEIELRPPHALILGYLLRNIDTDIDSDTLIALLWTEDGSAHQQTLYAYMNQVRILLEQRNIPLVIDKRMKGTYRISTKT